ncbi:MAG TPA: hypothetical protein VK003_10420 [Oceanobacillus sp.]|nr:hypothetical protein [Oceanobacillus sp.]
MQDVFLMYVGKAEQGESLRAAAELDGGAVYLPEHMMQALGMYITYLPNVIVVDSAVSYSEDVIMHLRSVDARPILLLTDEIHPRTDGIYTMPRGYSAERVWEAARQLASGSTILHVPAYANGYRRTG